MPSDDLTKTEETKTPETTPDYMTKADHTQAFESLVDALKGSLDKQNEAIAALGSRIPEAPLPDVPNPDEAIKTAFEQHIENPAKFAREQAELVIREQLVPHLTNQANDKYNDTVNTHATVFDAKYGEGAFEKNVREDLDKMFNNSTMVAQKSNNAIIKQGIDQIMGSKIDSLAQLAESHKQALDKEKADSPTPAFLLPNGLPQAPTGTLTNDETEMVNKHKYQGGADWDVASLISIRDNLDLSRGVTLDEYLANQKDSK